MNKKLLVKLCLLNFGIAIVNIFAFSDAFMGIILSEDTAAKRALGYTILLMSTFKRSTI